MLKCIAIFIFTSICLYRSLTSYYLEIEVIFSYDKTEIFSLITKAGTKLFRNFIARECCAIPKGIFKTVVKKFWDDRNNDAIILTILYIHVDNNSNGN